MGKRKGELVVNLLKLGQDGALDASLLTEQTQSIKLDDQVPELVLTLEEWLMQGEKRQWTAPVPPNHISGSQH